MINPPLNLIMMETKTLSDNKKLAFIYMFISAVFFTLMSTAVKYGSDISFIHKVFFRNFITFLMIFFLIHKKNISICFNINKYFYLLVLRALTGLAGVLCYFYALKDIPLADACILNKLSPFFIIIFSSLFLKEKINRNTFFLIVISFIGTVLIIKPAFHMALYPASGAVLSAFFAGISYTIIRSLKKIEKPEIIILYFSGISSLLLLFPSFLTFKSYNYIQLSVLCLIGIFATGGQFFLTKGFQVYNAGEISIVSYSQILFSFIIDIFLFKEFPDFYSLTGGCLIIISGIIFYLKK